MSKVTSYPLLRFMFVCTAISSISLVLFLHRSGIVRHDHKSNHVNAILQSPNNVVGIPEGINPKPKIVTNDYASSNLVRRYQKEISLASAAIPSLISLQKNANDGNDANHRKRDTLVVLTTCNFLKTTVLVLNHWKRSLDIADLIIVDDHSIDGTVAYLRKKGYLVLTNDKPTGLTNSWNRGYHFAVSKGYHYIIFANNDAIMPMVRTYRF